MSNRRPFHDKPVYIDSNMREKFKHFIDSYFEYLKDIKDSNYEDILQFEHYIPKGINLDNEKIKIILSVMNQNFGSNNKNNIMSYIDQMQYGWHGGRYKIRNPCLRLHTRDHCKKAFPIKYMNGAFISVEKTFNVIRRIFFNSEYGKRTLLIFSYCLASLFASKLEEARFNIPFLQIACNFETTNNSVYRLIQKIVTICDVNSGILSKCSNNNKFYGECGNYDRHISIYPTQFIKDQVNELCYNQDIPLVIDGRENDRFYKAMLREAANVSNKNKPLTGSDRFNLLPIFICPNIESSFNNFLDFDLTGTVISEEYLNLIEEWKPMLAAWVYKLVTEFHDIFQEQKQEVYPFDKKIKNKIDHIRGNHTGIDFKDTDYIGFLSFFFEMYMNVFKSLNQVNTSDNAKEKFKYKKNSYGVTDIDRIITSIASEAEASLIELNKDYIPELLKPMKIELEEYNSPTAQRIEKEIITLASRIEKYYKSYRVAIHITKSTFQNKRYIFDVDILPGTTLDNVKKHEDEVKQLLGYELFAVGIKNISIQIITAKKLETKCNLINILESHEFKKSKMKIPYAVGYDTVGNILVADIAEFPHLMIGGATGAGKSSTLHSLVMSIVYKQSVNDVNLLLLDFGGSGLELFDNIPHLCCPVITETEDGRKAVTALQKEMEKRKKMRIEQPKEFEKLPAIVCVIDEFIAFIERITYGKKNKNSHTIISDLLGRGRKEKIYMVLSALNPIAENIKCDISSITARIALKCATLNNSRTIIGDIGAEKLVGKGSMYFKDYEHDPPIYVQGAYIEKDKEIPRTLRNIDWGDKKYTFKEDGKYMFKIDESDSFISTETDELVEDLKVSADDEKFISIIKWLSYKNNFACSAIQAEFHIGYGKANDFLKILESWDYIEQGHGNTGWKIKSEKFDDMLLSLADFMEENDYSDKYIADILDNIKGTDE